MYLIRKRSCEKRVNTGVWTVTGRGVIVCESYLEAARREVQEELGIQLCLEKEHLAFMHEGQQAICAIFTVSVVHNAELKLNSREVEQIKWVPYEEIERMKSTGSFWAPSYYRLCFKDKPNQS